MEERKHRDRSLKGRTTSSHEDLLRYRFELHEDVPWKSVALALFLLVFGSLFLAISHFIYTEHTGRDSSLAYGLLVLGVLLFLPGFYETRIAYYSWRGYKGYSYSRIPAYWRIIHNTSTKSLDSYCSIPEAVEPHDAQSSYHGESQPASIARRTNVSTTMWRAIGLAFLDFGPFAPRLAKICNSRT
jgi:hypothetical protein